MLAAMGSHGLPADPVREAEALRGHFRDSVFPVLLFVGGFYAAFSGALFLGEPGPWVKALWGVTVGVGVALAGGGWLVRHRDLSDRAVAAIVGALGTLVIVHDLATLWLLDDPGQAIYLMFLLAAAGLFLIPRTPLVAVQATALVGWAIVAIQLDQPILGDGTGYLVMGCILGWLAHLTRVQVIRTGARRAAVLEGTLDASEDRFRTLAETAKDTILLLDASGRLVYLNPAGLKAFGIGGDEVKGRFLTQHLTADQPLQDLLGTHELQLQRRDGTRFPAELSLARTQRGEGVAYTGVLRDVSERVKADAASKEAAAREAEVASLRQMNEFKTRFLNMAAHELNTPLTPLRLQLHLLKSDQMGPLNEKQTRAVALLDRNVMRLSGLVGELLDVARMQGGRLRLVPQQVSVDEVVDEVLDSFDEASRRVGVALSFAGVQGLRVHADRNRTMQVLFNLVSNAVKFTPGGGRVTVEAMALPDRVHVSVTDTGMGLSPEQVQRLFQPFSQVHDPGTITAGGTGLGLYISKGLVEAQGGRLQVTSPGPGLGSTFSFDLPLSTGMPNAVPTLPPMSRPATTAEPEEDAIVRRLRELI